MIPRQMQRKQAPKPQKGIVDENPAQCVPNNNPLYRFEDLLTELPLHLLTLLIRARLAVQGHQGTKVELGLLEELDLADVDLYIPC